MWEIAGRRLRRKPLAKGNSFEIKQNENKGKKGESNDIAEDKANHFDVRE